MRSISNLKISEENLSDFDDIDFKNLGCTLNSIRMPSLKLETTLIKNIGLLRLKPVSIDQQVERDIGDKTIIYSSIVYNKWKDKACCYFENNCSGRSSYASFVFRHKGRWDLDNYE